MLKTFRVRVTQEILDEATREDSGQSDHTEALRHAGANSTRVTADTVAFNFEGTRYTYPLPAKAIMPLVRFDQGQPVEPFEFTLRAGAGSERPVRVYGPRPRKRRKNGAAKPIKRRKTARRSIRRFHGIRIVEVPASS